MPFEFSAKAVITPNRLPRVNWPAKLLYQKSESDILACLELGRAAVCGASPGGPTYVSEPFLNKDGRRACPDALVATSDAISSCQTEFADDARVQRCMVNATADVETLAMGKGEAM